MLVQLEHTERQTHLHYTTSPQTTNNTHTVTMARLNLCLIPVLLVMLTLKASDAGDGEESFLPDHNKPLTEHELEKLAAQFPALGGDLKHGGYFNTFSNKERKNKMVVTQEAVEAVMERQTNKYLYEKYRGKMNTPVPKEKKDGERRDPDIGKKGFDPARNAHPDL